MATPVEVLSSADGQRRVVIFQRHDGTFGYQEEYRYKSAVAEGWARVTTGASIYDSLEIARREIPHNVTWLAETAG